MATYAEAAPSATPWRFVWIVFLVAAIISVVIAWLGITGRLGGPIPGTSPGSGFEVALPIVSGVPVIVLRGLGALVSGMLAP
jgi:hypothetical protein